MKRPAIDKAVQQAVDRLLLEQGAYTPLELLLAEGRLLFADYEDWRAGQLSYLDELLFGDPEQSQTLLQQAAGYAQALGLEAEALAYPPWGGGANQPFSPHAEFDRLFHTRYRKPETAPQLDLFMDTSGASLVNGIRQALIGRDPSEARRQLDLLFDTDPGNHQLGGLERLIEAAEQLPLPVEETAGELETLQQELRPLALDLLGAGSRDYLAPFWRRLLETLWEQPFDPEHPERHASFMALQLEDWDLVQQSIEDLAEWHVQPVLLRRFARASGRLQQPERAACCWFLLCWRFPDQAEAIGREAEPLWRQRWRRFQELEPELPNRDFPAWSLLEQPALVKRLETADCFTDVEIPQAYRVTAELVSASAAALPAGELIEQRKRLKALNPSLFDHYLERFGRG
ncbi:MAG: hypothetical protein PVG22_16940 [Chromatiales bacterium]|jgi:hypothetical protein